MTMHSGVVGLVFSLASVRRESQALRLTHQGCSERLGEDNARIRHCAFCVDKPSERQKRCGQDLTLVEANLMPHLPCCFRGTLFSGHSCQAAFVSQLPNPLINRSRAIVRLVKPMRTCRTTWLLFSTLKSPEGTKPCAALRSSFGLGEAVSIDVAFLGLFGPAANSCHCSDIARRGRKTRFQFRVDVNHYGEIET